MRLFILVINGILGSISHRPNRNTSVTDGRDDDGRQPVSKTPYSIAVARLKKLK